MDGKTPAPPLADVSQSSTNTADRHEAWRRARRASSRRPRDDHGFDQAWASTDTCSSSDGLTFLGYAVVVGVLFTLFSYIACLLSAAAQLP